MNNMKKIAGQRGTLMIEAIAMLGLIALVTPTLYKKSAERLQEIQDINVASQARTMNSIIENFIYANYSDLIEHTSSGTQTVKLCYNGSSEANDCYDKAYSTYVPFGYTPGKLKTYGEPEVYVHNDESSLISYIVYPAVQSNGAKRAARVASLVGANGGTVQTRNNNTNVYGTGGAWELDHSLISEMNMNEDALVENSLVVTSTEPITMTNMDSEKFLYRVLPEDGKDYHNQMVTDLYMGGHDDSETHYSGASKEFYSIFNVRKLTLNTNCSRGQLNSEGTATVQSCNFDPSVADLYIGKPENKFENGGTLEGLSANTGAAWIYGNLYALSENFRLRNDSETGRSGQDIMEFVRHNEEAENYDGDFEVFSAKNGINDEAPNAIVSMINGFVQARETNGSDHDFIVGGGYRNNGELSTDYYIHALMEGDNQTLRLNTPDSAASGPNMTTEINRKGGTVYIGGSNDEEFSKVFINDAGGELAAGKDAGWMHATDKDGSAKVHLLSGNNWGTGADERIFSVGDEEDKYSSGNMIYGDSSKVSLRGGQLRVYNYTADDGDSLLGGSARLSELGDTENSALTGATAILSRYTDIMGATFLGNQSMVENVGDDYSPMEHYSRSSWTLGVAGSAWVDDMLWARHAWFRDAGFRELHAGFTNYDQYSTAPKTGMLNAYSDKVVIRGGSSVNADTTDDEAAFGEGVDTMMYVGERNASPTVRFEDLSGAGLEMNQGIAKIGTKENYFEAQTAQPGEEGRAGLARVVGKDRVEIFTSDKDGDSSVVNIQNDAMIFNKSFQAGYPNTIDAKAQHFSIQTAQLGAADDEKLTHTQFYMDSSRVLTRDVTMEVWKENEFVNPTFRVVPDLGKEGALKDESDANVNVRGTLHVTGNNIIHVSSGDENTAGKNDNEPRAMLEVDPQHIQVWSKTGSSDSDSYSAPGGGDSYYAMVKINPYDVSGAARDESSDSASVYIRRGAIELEQSRSSGGDTSWAANEGYGYIMGNRFVSNADGVEVPVREGDHGTQYDQYMVNPAYTSVMHDIKLTTRGGARLSDILPDYVLKGVYNVINNCDEGTTGAVECTRQNMDAWADAYVGIVPYASCPPGYNNMATLIPISFNIGVAGDLIKEARGGDSRLVVSSKRQAALVGNAGGHYEQIAYPTFEEVSSAVYNEIINEQGSFNDDFSSKIYSKSEGWFMGFKTNFEDNEGISPTTHVASVSPATDDPKRAIWKKTEGSDESFIPTPIYFQQNTWLKTTLDPDSQKGWKAYMGFLYDKHEWDISWGLNRPVKTQHNATQTGADDLSGDYVWNLFPVPTNTIEGHATVYCYFDRAKFKGGWENMVDDIDQLGALKNEGSATFREYPNFNKPADYIKRLNDPTLKYTDPW